MKRIIALILAIFIFALPAFAQNEDKVELIYLDGVDVYEAGDEVLGMNKEEFADYLKAHNILLYGIAKDKSYVVEIGCDETKFSTSVKDFKNVKLSDVKDFADSTKILNYNIEQLGDAVYIIRNIETPEGEAKTFQFITVKQGFVYVITLTTDGDIDKAKGVVGSIVYNFAETPAQISIWHIVIVSALIIVVLAVLVIVTVTVIKDLKKKRRVKEME